MRVRRILLFLVAACTALAVPVDVREARGAPPQGDVPEEHADVAIPQAPPADTRPSGGINMTLSASTLADLGPPIDDFRYDPLVLKGYANEVCASSIGRGSSWTFWEIVDQFGGTAGTMNVCRERWDVANNPDCNGTVASPASRFYSTCWSNHATGRAIDIMVGGSASSGYNRQRGLNIVNWLLAPDGFGNVNARARRMGIQQILFADRCWNSDGDRGIANWSQMRPCGIGHFDHVHLDLTHAGAAGTVSYWGGAPSVEPKPDTLALFDFTTNWRQAVSWRNFRETDEEGTSVLPGYDRAIPCDCDGDRVTSEIFLWDMDTGMYLIQEWRDGDSYNARLGQLTHRWDDVVVGDFDNDGAEDDMIFWDRATGTWVADSWFNFNRTRRASGKQWAAYDELIAGDFDDDGHVDDTIFWDHDAGHVRVLSWWRFQPTYRHLNSWATRFESAIVGDFDAGGNLNEVLLWDRETGDWILQVWDHGAYVNRASGRWGNFLDVAVSGDFDTDGRQDDVFVYDDATGRWWIYSFHRLTHSARRSGTWNTGFDSIAVGAFNE